jgi:hypothetical protein
MKDFFKTPIRIHAVVKAVSRRSFLFIPLFLLPLVLGACSTEGVSCSGAVCAAGEICEAGKCVLGLSFDGASEGESCQSDEDCPEDAVCTHASSKPASTCIAQLDCDLDGDCQSGLRCANDGICR